MKRYTVRYEYIKVSGFDNRLIDEMNYVRENERYREFGTFDTLEDVKKCYDHFCYIYNDKIEFDGEYYEVVYIWLQEDEWEYNTDYVGNYLLTDYGEVLKEFVSGNAL